MASEHSGVTARSIRSLLAEGTARLHAARIDDPRRESQLLLAHALGIELSALLLADRDGAVAAPAFDALLVRRAAHEPLAHLTGRRGFWTLDLLVSPATLIPRADSETLIEALIATRPDRHAVGRVLDLGTGTGCLLLAALSEYPQAWGLGVERRPEAAALARANAAANGLGSRCAILCGDWMQALAVPDGGFDVVLSNPPYIPHGDLSGLMEEVRRYEPAGALDGGSDGLDDYRRLLPMIANCLARHGVAILELGHGQAHDVQALARAACLATVALRHDLGGVARALVLEHGA